MVDQLLKLISRKFGVAIGTIAVGALTSNMAVVGIMAGVAIIYIAANVYQKIQIARINAYTTN